MEDLIPPQIKDSCKLALPDGLKELMSDISREVLRYQPRDLYKFIADYLSALLITRDNLSIAGYICSDIAKCGCEPELQYELRDIGVDEDDIIPARDIIVKYFEKGEVNETSLLMKLLNNTNIDEDMLPAVQEAIRSAFLRHQAHNTVKYESSSDSEHDDMMSAAKHTLNLYRRTAPSQEVYGIMADKIQKSYRAYGVKRDLGSKDKTSTTKPSKSFETGDRPTQINRQTIPERASYDAVFPKSTYPEETGSAESLIEDPEIAMTSSMSKKRVTTISSTSLAGSFMTLPPFKPYSAHEKEVLSDLEEYPEKEHAYIDYTADSPHVSMVNDDKDYFRRDKKISFTDAEPVAAKLGLIVDDDDYASIQSSRSNEMSSSNKVDSRLVYPCNVMTVDSNRGSSSEMERSVKLGDSENNDDEILEEIQLSFENDCVEFVQT